MLFIKNSEDFKEKKKKKLELTIKIKKKWKEAKKKKKKNWKIKKPLLLIVYVLWWLVNRK